MGDATASRVDDMLPARVDLTTPTSSVIAEDSAQLASARRSVVFVHGTSRDDKLWPEDHWLALGRLLIAEGWTIELPHGGGAELERAQRLARLLGPSAQVWPTMSLDAVVDAMGAAQGCVGVDSGLSHVAVALGLPHVQIYNLPTAWRTGPLVAHGHRHQRSIEGTPVPTVAAVQAAWAQVTAPADAPLPGKAGPASPASSGSTSVGTADVRPAGPAVSDRQ